MTSIKISDKNAVRDMYDAEAESYSKMMDSEIEHPLYADTLERLQTRIQSLPGTLIDAPCGSGHMLSMYNERYDSERALFGIDLSPQMVAISTHRLGSAAEICVGDIRDLQPVETGSAAAVISHFAVHHLDADGVAQALEEWHRVLKDGGQLLVAAWEGTGALDYGEDSDLVAIKHAAADIENMFGDAGFSVSMSKVEFDDDMQMNALYIEATKK
jgi:ubiquinone/menaquinone biosynthesis C-methylase UbiE